MSFLNWFFGKRNEEQLKFDLFSPAPFYKLSGQEEMLNMVIKHPAVLKVFALQCDLFSLGEVYVEDKDGNLLPDDPFIKLINSPNRFDMKSDFLWMYMFNLMLGNAYCYVESDIVEKSNNVMYMLDSWKIDIPKDLKKEKDTLIQSGKEYNRISDINVKYYYSSGGFKNIPWKNIVHVADLSIGSRFEGRSRLEALTKIIANSEASLDSENINIRLSGQFMVSGRADLDNVDHMPMHQDEKDDIESKILKRNPVTAVKSLIDIKRFVEDSSKQELDKKYLNAYFLIGKMWGIPRDVLEAYESSTFENQEKARGAHVSYSLQPKGNSFFNGLEEKFGYKEEGKNIYIDWEHLPFMQVFAEQRAETKKKTIETLGKMADLGIPIREINSFLETDFSHINPIKFRNDERGNGEKDKV